MSKGLKSVNMSSFGRNIIKFPRMNKFSYSKLIFSRISTLCDLYKIEDQSGISRNSKLIER